MTKREHLKKTLNSIKQQFVGTSSERNHFLAAFYSHYLFKTLGLKGLIKFPKAKFKYQNVILETRPETIDFWVTLETCEPDLTLFLTEYLGDDKGTFIDVGAHIGRYSTLMAKKDWHVLSFEPLKTNFNALENNLAMNRVEKSATLFNAGLGNENRDETIYFNKKELSEASLSQKEGDDSKDSVKILRFDDIYKEVNIKGFCIVKVDVEGFEEQVLEGMHDFVKAEKPLFIIELWVEKSPKLVQFLKSQGYKRLHIFWFIEGKHSEIMDKMHKFYNRCHLSYDYE